jgi:predicted transcriptional regulator
MPKKKVSFLVPEEKINKLDALADLTGHDRSFYLNEAVDLFLNLTEHHSQRIEQGISDIEAGRVSLHNVVLQTLQVVRQRRQT